MYTSVKTRNKKKEGMSGQHGLRYLGRAPLQGNSNTIWNWIINFVQKPLVGLTFQGLKTSAVLCSTSCELA